MKFSIKDFFSKCDQICSFLRIWSHLLKKSLIENFIFYAVLKQTCSSKFHQKYFLVTSTLGKPLVEKVYIKGTIGSRTYVKCYSEKGLQPNWYQKRDDGKTVLLPPSFQESVGVIKIWGKSRKVLLLKIISLGHGSLATYSCKVKFGNTSLESFVHISSTKDGKHTNF